ncbi:MAG: hypothetical protein ACRDBG_14230, partial [Waterburya sp.]
MDGFEKGKDISKLVKKTITDKRGRPKTVWVDPNKDDVKPERQKQTVPEKWVRTGEKDERGNSILEKNPEYQKHVDRAAKEILYAKMKEQGLNPSDVSDKSNNKESDIDAVVNSDAKKSDKVRQLL